MTLLTLLSSCPWSGIGRPRAAPARYREGERAKAAVIDAAPDAVVVSDAEGRILDLNAAAERLFGHVAGRPLADLLVLPAAGPGSGGPLTGLDRRTSLEARGPDGTLFPAEAVVRRLSTGRRTLFAAYVRDLTAERAAAAARDAEGRRREQDDRTASMGALLSGVAHELNNPLAILVAQATLLRERAPDADVERRAEKIQAAAQRASRIVKSFLAVAQRRPPVLAPLDLDIVVDDALDLADHALRSAGIAVERHRGTRLPPIDGDRELLGQVLAHFLMEAQTALQGRAEGRRLTIRTQREDGRVVLSYTDNGTRIAPEVVSAGTGAGLSLCRSVLDAHAGTMTLDTSPEGGNLVRIALPTRAAERAGPVTGLAVLVVDDEIDVGQSLAELIEIFGHRVTIETAAAAALERLDTQSFDAVFTDLRMPGLDGLALRRAIRRRDPGLAERTVIVTGDVLAMAPGERPPLGEPAGLTLAKPFTAAEVKTLLARVRV